MRVSVDRGHRVNYGDYEHGDVKEFLSISHQDLGYSDEEWAAHIKKVGTSEAYDELHSVAQKLVDREVRRRLAIHETYILEDQSSFVELLNLSRGDRS